MIRTISTVALKIALVLPLMGGCVPAADTLCTTTGIIKYRGATDHPDTIRQIREHNAVWRDRCG